MVDTVHRRIELVGTSTESIEDAVENAISRASQTMRHLEWFEVLETRGSIKNDRVREYQVVIKVGFVLEEVIDDEDEDVDRA
jgi:flavin-binding protein dodecin